MIPRQRMLLMLIDDCRKEGQTASIHELAKRSAMCESTVWDDVRVMEKLGMVVTDKERVGSTSSLNAQLTATGEKRLPRVRELA